MILAADRTALKAEGLADVCEADALGRLPAKSGDGPALMRELIPVVRGATIGQPSESLVGPEIGLWIRAERGRVVAEYMKARNMKAGG